MVKHLVKTLAQNLVKTLAKNLVKNLGKNLLKMFPKSKKVVVSKGRLWCEECEEELTIFGSWLDFWLGFGKGCWSGF